MLTAAKKGFGTGYLLVALLGFAQIGCDEGSDYRRVTTGQLDISGPFVFPKTAPGDTSDRLVTIRNIGPAEVTLTRFDAHFSDEFAVGWSVADVDGLVGDEGTESFPNSVVLEPRGTLKLRLRYAPETEDEPSGHLNISTNSGFEAERELEIPIAGLEANGELHAGPSPLRFGRIPVGEVADREVVITNLGTETTNIESIQIFSSERYTIRVRGIDPAQDPSVLMDPDGDGTPGLSPSQAMPIQVFFEPDSDLPEIGELHIMNNGANPKVVIPLLANGAGPCLRAHPSPISFGNAGIGLGREQSVIIESCGTDNITIESIEVVAGTEVFSISRLPDLPGTLPGADFDRRQYPRVGMTVRFNPTAEQNYVGTVRIRSTDPVEPVIEIPLEGLGIQNECPHAVVAQDAMEVRPLDMVTLDGGPSTDLDGPDGRPVNYEWVVIQRPEGSTAHTVEQFHDYHRPADGGTPDALATPIARLFVDLAGEYVVALRVMDRLGAVAPSDVCPQDAAQVRIKAVPSERLHVQLVWDTPADEDQTDEIGTDVDLHLRHPTGSDWFTQNGGLDCFFMNRAPDWGQSGVLDDDPSLDIDDVNGAGPENINIPAPEDTTALGAPYRIGVHYYQSEIGAFGQVGETATSDVTVRIYVDGELSFESRKTLDETDDFWDVAAVHWEPSNVRIVEDGNLSIISP